MIKVVVIFVSLKIKNVGTVVYSKIFFKLEILFKI